MSQFHENLIRSINYADYIITVPTSGINEVYSYFEKHNKCIYVTREEEGVALASGLSIGGKKIVMLIQQSGVGNLLNAIFTLADPYGIDFTIIVMVRGGEDENPIHWISSERTVKILEGLGSTAIDWISDQCDCLFQQALKNKNRWIISHY
ncbi:MAG: thiamine pyrophosphate-binding protein [Flavisolibacter sp.]